MPDVDPVFGSLRLLRPFQGYETVYQGNSTLRPIMFTESDASGWGQALDEQVILGTDGYSPDLIKGLSVPVGARVLVWLPTFRIGAGNGYSYVFMWRARNLFDWRTARIPWSLPKQAAGFADGADERVVIPGAHNIVTYQQAEPAFATAANQHIQVENYRVPVVQPPAQWNLPYVPNGNDADICQGFPDSFGNHAGFPEFVITEIQAVADQLMIGIIRDEDVAANWDFAGADALVSDWVSSSTDAGIYVSVGSAP